MAVLLGLAVALSYGAADFLGGFASQRSFAMSVVVMAQFVGLALAIVCAFAFGWDAVTGNDVALSAGAGFAQVTGVTALYQGLAVGRMSVVAPVSAVTSAIVPIGYGLATGEDPAVIALVGVALAIVAVAIVARAPDAGADAGTAATGGRAALFLALAAGVGFGISFVCFAETSTDSGFVPVVLARAFAGTVMLIALLAAGRTVLPAPSERPIAAATGVLDMTANGLLLVAVRGELLSLVAPVASLYPASTVLLARVVLREPIGRERLAGLALAILALMLIAV